MSVRCGEYDTQKDIDCEDNGYSVECAPPPQNIPVVKSIVHEDYDPFDSRQLNDIAILKLGRKIQYNGKCYRVSV